MVSEAVNKQLGSCLALPSKTWTVLRSFRHEEPGAESCASHGPKLPER